MNYNKLVFDRMKKLAAIGIKEIAGVQDNPWIVNAHRLCSITGKASVDEIPWCSSGMNRIVCEVMFQVNPARTAKILKARGVQQSMIQKLADAVSADINFDSGAKVFIPMLSAAASSWKTFGEAVKISEAQLGDFVVLVRRNWRGKIIGHHIALLDEAKMGMIYSRLLGCNQSNMLCSSNSYLRVNVVAVRRLPNV